LGLPGPLRPVLTSPGAAPLPLPLTLATGAFRTEAPGEILNSTWFQVAADNRFLSPAIDRVRDVENFFGDTGAPLYEPVDKHAGTDITRLTLPVGGLGDGVWFA